MIPIPKSLTKFNLVLLFTCIACLTIFVLTCIHVHKVNEMYLRNNAGKPFAVIVITL